MANDHEACTPRSDVLGGDPDHAHLWTWTSDNNSHMGFECACGAYRP